MTNGSGGEMKYESSKMKDVQEPRRVMGKRTMYVESAAGVAQGGRTGLAAFAVGCCFIVALFFSPLFLSIPSAATAPVLIIVGLLMLEPVKNIDFSDYTESIPAFVCIALMPLSYSISDGILIGMICYVLLNILCGKPKKISVMMYILATLFILKYIFIVVPDKPQDADSEHDAENIAMVATMRDTNVADADMFYND